MTSFTIGDIAAARDALADRLASGAASVRLEPEDDLDAAGAQLLAAAVVELLANGRALRIELPAGGPAEALWRKLALDTLAAPVTDQGQTA